MIVLITLGALAAFAMVVWTSANGWLRHSLRRTRKSSATAGDVLRAAAAPGRVVDATPKRLLVPPRVGSVLPRLDDAVTQPMAHVTTHVHSGADSEAADTAWPSTNWPTTQPSTMAPELASEAAPEFAPTQPMQLEVLTPN